MRGFMLFAIALAFASAGAARGAEQPAPAPPAKTKTDQQELLQRKLAELAALQRDVRDLRSATGRPAEIVIQVQVIELSRTKMRDLGIDFKNALPSKGADSKVIAQLVSMLEREGAVNVLSDPGLLVSDGRPAHFFNGGEIPISVKHADGSTTVEGRKIGTQIDVVANLAGAESMHLNFRASHSELDPAFGGTIENVAVPGLRLREIDTALEMKLGQTAILGAGAERKVVTAIRPFEDDTAVDDPAEDDPIQGDAAKGDAAATGLISDEPISTVEEFETLFLVTPQLVKPAK